MANQTIEGCVNWPAGTVTFDGYACDSGDYTGCIVFDNGIHHGQVKIVVNEAKCDDTYYGCVDWADGGKFKVVIPDDCCIEWGYDCGYCDAGETPQYLTVTFAGVIACEGWCTSESPSRLFWTWDTDPNGTYLLTQIGSGADACEWNKRITTGDSGYHYEFHNGYGCSNYDHDTGEEDWGVEVLRFETYIEVALGRWRAASSTVTTPRAFYATYSTGITEDMCLDRVSSISNTLTCDMNLYTGEGGTAIVREGDWT